MKQLWDRLFPRPPAPIVFERTRPQMSAEQIRQALAGWDENDLKFRAVWDLLGELYEGEMLSLSQQHTRSEMFRWNGRIEILLHLRLQLAQYRQLPRYAE